MKKGIIGIVIAILPLIEYSYRKVGLDNGISFPSWYVDRVFNFWDIMIFLLMAYSLIIGVWLINGRQEGNEA